ncbi:MAG: phytoene/squalene synthase family protein [Fibrobacterales bacterium]
MPNIDEYTQFGVDFSARTCREPYKFSAFMLEKVSRTFAINIKVLPFPLRKPILLAYLFCRIADTVEDDPVMDGLEKKEHLDRFKDIFENIHSRDYALAAAEVFSNALPESWKSEDNQDYSQILSLFTIWPLDSLLNLSDANINGITKWVLEMCDGMITYGLKDRDAGKLMSLATLDELDEYCYYVAGTVGYMLCDLFLNYSPLITVGRYKKMTQLANSFGLGLQLTNIIKDVAEDMTRDICFIPQELAQRHTISTDQLLDPAFKEQSLDVMRDMIMKALIHLEDAVHYTMLLPRLEPKIRLFCLWPLFMASQTLVKASEDFENLLNPNIKLKITRPQVKKIILKTTFLNFSNRYIKNRFIQEKAIILENLKK